MQINELVNESGNINEAQPMGFLSKLGNKALAGTGNFINQKTGIMPNFGAKAHGRLNIGALANQVMAGYQKFLGQTGDQPTEANLLAYLKKQGYPLDNAKQVLSQASPITTQSDIKSPTPAPAATPAPAPTAPAPEASPTAPAPSASESMRKLLNVLTEGPNDPIDMKLVAKAIQAAAQQHAGAQVKQADPTDVAQPTPGGASAGAPENSSVPVSKNGVTVNFTKTAQGWQGDGPDAVLHKPGTNGYNALEGEWARSNGSTPADIRNAAAPTSNETDPQSNVTTTNAPAAGKRIGKQQGTQAVDNAMQTLSAVEPGDQAAVIDYAQQRLDSLKQSTITAKPDLKVEPGGKSAAV